MADRSLALLGASATVALVVVYVAAAVFHFADLDKTQHALVSHRVVPSHVGRIWAALVAPAESMVAVSAVVLLFWSTRAVRLPAWLLCVGAAFTLLTYSILALKRAPGVACGCGFGDQPLSRGTVYSCVFLVCLSLLAGLRLRYNLEGFTFTDWLFAAVCGLGLALNVSNIRLTVPTLDFRSPDPVWRLPK